MEQFARGGREMWLRDECVRMLHEQRDIEPGSPQREDVYHHMAYKAKSHRPIPESGYTAKFSVIDDEPLQGEAN